MSDVCLSGLQGFPVQITGWSGYTEKSSLAIPNDIQLQFSPSESPMLYDSKNGELTQKSSSGNTFFMGGTLFTVKSIRLSQPKQDGLNNFSAKPVAEFQIWGTVNPSAIPKYDLAVIIIPLYTKAEESEQGANIINAVNGNPVRLMDCIPSGKNTMVVRYVTCIETDNTEKKTVKVAVAYFSDGVAINTSQTNRLSGRLGSPGIPNVFGFKVLSRFEQYNDPGRTKGNRQYITENNILQAYQTTLALSTSTPEFRQGFRIIFNFIKRDTATEKNLGAYKCIAIDKQRDIKNNQLVVDPKTGRRLDDELLISEKQEAESLPTTKGNIRDTFMTIAIIVGVILGLTGLAILFTFIATVLFNRKGQGILDPIPPQVQKLYDTLPPNIVGK
jgi:hypothetical protein